MTYLSTIITVYLIQKISKSVLAKYANYIDFFSKKLVKKLSKYLNINKYSINLEFDKQLPYKLIYSLKLVELKTLKIYIYTNLANSFI